MAKERRLTFIQSPPGTYQIYNCTKELIGLVKKVRVGQYLHWCFTIPDYLFTDVQTDYYYYSAGCMDEIREFMKNPDKYKEKYPEQVK